MSFSALHLFYLVCEWKEIDFAQIKYYLGNTYLIKGFNWEENVSKNMYKKNQCKFSLLFSFK